MSAGYTAILPKCPHQWPAPIVSAYCSLLLFTWEARRAAQEVLSLCDLVRGQRSWGKCPTGHSKNWRTPGVCESAPIPHLGKLWMFFLRLNEIFPGLTSFPGPGGKQLGSRVPGKDVRIKREKTYLWWALAHGATPHVCVHRGIIITLWEIPPTWRNPDGQRSWVD